MQYKITLDLMTYILVLIAFGSIGSCYQAYKEFGTPHPFWARLLTGAFAGSITMLVVNVLKLQDSQPIIHFGIAVLLGFMAEKGEGNKIVSLLFKGGK